MLKRNDRDNSGPADAISTLDYKLPTFFPLLLETHLCEGFCVLHHGVSERLLQQL
jgi:hypothetical protein